MTGPEDGNTGGHELMRFEQEGMRCTVYRYMVKGR